MFGQKRLSREGGVEIVVKELCTRMAQNGCDVTCYNRAGHHVSGAEYDDAGKTEYEGIRQKSVPTIERRGLAAVSSSAFAALYSAFGKYDVVHIHAEGPAFFAWLPKMFGKRVVVTVHGIDWQREKWQSGLGSKFIHQGEKNAAKYADEVIVLSKGVQDYFKETYGRETHFIPNGVNRPQIREANLITEKFGLKKDSYILFLGRLVPEKGIRYLVEAFKNVKTDKKLVIAGGSSDTDSFMEELKELAKGDDRILFTGFVQGAMLDELYSNAYMAKNGCRIGGEQSGHIIFSKYASTGDGILTSLKMMEVMLAKKKPMSELAAPLKIYPQVLENVRVTDKKAAQNDPAVQEAVSKVAEALGDTGRMAIRSTARRIPKWSSSWWTTIIRSTTSVLLMPLPRRWFVYAVPMRLS